MAPTRSTGPEVGACGYGCMERELASQSDGSNMDGENAESPAVELSLLRVDEGEDGIHSGKVNAQGTISH